MTNAMQEHLAGESAHRAPLAANGERERLRQMFEQAPGFMALLEGADHEFAMVNQAFLDLIGKRDLLGATVADALPEFSQQGFGELRDSVVTSRKAVVGRAMPLQVARGSGPAEEIFVDFVFQPLTDADGTLSGIFVQGHDVTEHQRSDALREAHNHVLELSIGESPLEETLGELLKIVESTSKTGVLGSILLLDEDGKHLRHGAAPSLPAPYTEAINGAEIGPRVGSCGTAAYRAEPVFVSDIASDPLWADFRDLAVSNGLRSCWSIPIMTAGRKVLGTFAMYHREPREPTVRDLALVDLITQTAALIISRERAEAALRESERRFRVIAENLPHT
jgi:PAS domain S-box-containing protein